MTYKSRPMSVAHPSEGYMCGIGLWRPKWIQRFATTKTFIFIFGMIGILQGAAFAYMIGCITTLEKRYAFDSKITGLILISDSFVAIIFNPFFGYLANNIHRPRFIGYCQIVVVLGCYIASLPYFIYGAVHHYVETDQNSVINHLNDNKTVVFCDSNRRIGGECDDYQSNTVVPAVVILCLATACNGIGFVAFYTIGIPFIDDNVKKKNSPLYISTTAALRLCGPTFGFMLSSICLRFYENPFIDPGITDKSDPRWIGAWWIGFVIIGTGTLIFTIPLFLFPSDFKNPLKETENQIKTKPLLRENRENELRPESNIWKRVLKLVKNPIYMCYVIGTTIRLFAVIGYLSFQSKFIENEFKNSASFANMTTGLVDVIPSAFGIFLGGYLISRFQPSPKFLTTFITIVEMIGALGFLAALFLGCPLQEFAGTQTNTHFEMQSICNDNCFCSEKVMQPICAVDSNTNYFSPCFAGCRPESLTHNSSEQYSDCRCISGPVTEGYCKRSCSTFVYYVTFLGVSNLIGSLAKTGNTIISFRIVDARDKTFSIGLMGAFMCIFAFIPGPLVYGAVTDAACLIWEQWCGQKGNCWVYDSQKFRNYLHGLTVGLYFTGSIFDIIVIFLSKRIKNLYDDIDLEPEAESPINLKLSSSVDKHLSLESKL